MSRMHAEEIDVEDSVVHRLLAEQLPQWAGMPLRRLSPTGTDKQLFRLGDELLPRQRAAPRRVQRAHVHRLVASLD